MSFNLTPLQPQSNPQSPGSSSSSSIDDQVNNPTARVYFGPIQSPEKILIAEATHNRDNLSSIPFRRSSRISALQSSQQLAFPMGEERTAVEPTLGDEREPQVTPPLGSASTSDEDSSQDDFDSEPASALATKVSRAHDNPSPPPNMQPLARESGNPNLPTPTEHHPLSDSDSVVLEASGSTVADESLPRTRSPITSPDSHETFTSLDRPPVASLPNNVSANLIAFDDDNLLEVPELPVVQEPDFLAPTPLRPPPHFLSDLESTSQTTDAPVCPIRDEGPEQDLTPLSKVATMHPASNSLTIESPVPLRRSPRLSRSGSPSFFPSQSDLVQRDEVDPSDTHSSQVTPFEKIGHSIVTKSPRQVRVGSLSPVSEDVLHNLLYSTSTSTLDQIPALASVMAAVPHPPNQSSTPVQNALPEQKNDTVAIYTVQRPPPERSPWRNHIANPRSPSKFGFNNTLHDPNRTPAQRIPIKEAIAQGSASHLKDCFSPPSKGIFGRPVFSRSTQEDRIRSPVRCPPDAANHTMMRPTGSASPEKVRSGSEEPQLTTRPHLGRPFQRSASDSEISSPSKTKIPTFPIRPRVDARLPSTIPEEHGLDSPTKLTSSSPSSKSTLRQPSSMAGSRIPRIGAKPYARPVEERQQGKGKEPVRRLFMTKRPISSVSAPTKPVRLVRSINAAGSGSSSEDSVNVRPGATSGSQISTSNRPQPSPSLKRKRSLEQMPSPRVDQPTFPRLVTSVSRQKLSSLSPQPPPDLGTLAKKPRMTHVRTVRDPTQKHAARNRDTQHFVRDATTIKELRPVSTPEEFQTAPPAPPTTPPPAPQTAPSLLIPPGVPTGSASPIEFQRTALQSEPNATSPNSPSDGSSSSAKRVTRSRRNPQPTTSDIFGPVRPLQPRRRRPTEAGKSTFSSMSALALKALTTSNTAKNQRNHVAVLETEVIRKPGNRPGSPTTKLKTIEEKRKLEQDQERKVRAERRSRRSSEAMEDSILMSDDEESLPFGPDGRPLRHRRGPGDEEDYESLEGPAKRSRIGEAEGLEEVAVKTVRWDRGLFTTFYFDDLPLQSQSGDKPQAAPTQSRGVLADSAKALPLDGLGNLANATSPLKDLVQENVVIKKFVYDDDAEAAVIDEPKPPPRGKGKKLKG